MKELMMVYQEKARADDANMNLKRFTKRIREFAADFENVSIPKYTGWFVLLKKNFADNSESGFDFVGFFNPDISDPETEPEWDIVMPIQADGTIKEFQGW